VQMFHWIQIEQEEAEKTKKGGVILKDTCFCYNHHVMGHSMVEYHVDSCEFIQRKINEENVFRGCLSVRRDRTKKMMIKIKCNEEIIKQYLLTKKKWRGPIGESALVPKDDEMGLIISGTMSREFGWGLDLSKEELAQVTEMQVGKSYEDAESANAKCGSANKMPITESPFIREFKYGSKGEGYWNYEHMVIQLEDHIDCLKVLHPEYDFVFLLDHSCSRDRQDKKNFGGRQKKLCNTKIKQEDISLGPFSQTLKVGDIQKICFQSTFWIMPE
jgi:hypothetical protein